MNQATFAIRKNLKNQPLKKKLPLLLCVFMLALQSQAQISVAKLLGENSSEYGPGYGVFAYLDIPLASENRSIRVEFRDLAFFAKKGENIFNTKDDMRTYLSSKLGYKYVFSETQQGFYVLPAVGYCQIVDAVDTDGEPDKTIKSGGLASAMEVGYTLEVGQRSNTLNFGLKYEYDLGKAGQKLQSLGFRFSYGFGMFRRKDDY